MQRPETLLILLHLYLAAFLAPAFILVAVTGGLYVAGIKGQTTETQLTIPRDIVINPDSPDVEASVISVLVANDLTDLASNRCVSAATRSRLARPRAISSVLSKSDDGWSAALNQPDFQYGLMELHKGHGPALFKTYQIFVGIALFLVAIGGLAVGLLAKTYRMKTIVAMVVGTAGFVALAAS